MCNLHRFCYLKRLKVTDTYVAFRRIKNFACELDKILVCVKLNTDTVDLQPGFTRNVRKIGHFGPRDL